MRLKGLMIVLAACGMLSLLTGCMAVYSPAMGVLFTDVKGPVDAGDSVGTREGTACAESILGLVARGDASIKAAAADGNITRIASLPLRRAPSGGVPRDSSQSASSTKCAKMPSASCWLKASQMSVMIFWLRFSVSFMD